MLTALLSLMALSVVCTHLVSIARISTETAASRREGAALQAAADGVVRMAVFDLLRTSSAQSSLDRTIVMQLPDGRAVVRLRDQGGRINPNLASPQLFKALLIAVGIDDTTADSMTAAQVMAITLPSSGDTAALPGGGQRGNTPRPPLPFGDLSDLARLPGMTSARLRLLAPHLCVWWRGLPDPGLADPLVKLALARAGETSFAAATHPNERVVEIDTIVTASSGRIVTRSAVVRLGVGLNGVSFHFLAWS